MPAKVGYFCILLFLHVFLFDIERLDATAFSNFDLDTNWDTYLCANENPIVDEKTVILTATGLPTTYLPCLGLRKNLKISGEYQMSSQLINVGPANGERNFGLAFNAIDENNYDFVYLSYDKADSCTKMAYGYVEKESLTKGSTKSACMSIQSNKWNFLKITVKDDCDHCNNVDGYVNGQHVFSFEAHFATRGFGGALAENGFSNVVEFREFDIAPIIPSQSLPADEDCKMHFDVIDQGYVDNYRGWYDTRGCGTCNDYCRWVGNNGSGGDPSKRTVHGSSFWACQRPGKVYFDYKNEGLFVYKKCNKRGDKKASTTTTTTTEATVTTSEH